MRRFWQLAPGAVGAGRDITGTVITGPVQLQVQIGRFDRLNDAIFDPVALVDQLDLARFQGRAGLIARIDERIATQDRGYVIVRGEAGVGKSALAAHLVWTRPCVYHFTRLDGGARLPAEARKSVAAQLIGGWGLAERFTPGDVFPFAADRPDWLAKVIRAAAEQRDRLDPHRSPLVLVVDGLDEAQDDPPGMGTGVPLGLPAPDALPFGVYIVATSRFGLPLAALRDPERVGWSEIVVEGQDNLNDMLDYLRAVTGGPSPDRLLVDALRKHGMAPEAFIAPLMDRCNGVWIYLRYVLDEIRAGLRAPTDVVFLPDRLRGYYELQIGRWATDPHWQHLYLPVLAMIAALQRPITSAQLAEIFAFGHDQPVDSGAVAAWLDRSARAFLDVAFTSDGRRTYRVRHQSLRDLFAIGSADDPADAGLRDQLHITSMRAHRMITAWLTTAADRGGVRDWAAIDDYARLNLPRHAAAGGVLDILMSDPGFLLACPIEQILRHRYTLTTTAARAAAGAVEAASSEWTSRPGTDRAWWLHIWARKTRATTIADTIIAANPGWPWIVQTASWRGITHRTFTGSTGAVNALAVLPGPDGRYRIACGDDGERHGNGPSVRVWDVETGTQLAEMRGHIGPVTALAVLLGPDGRHRIASADSGDWVTGRGSVRVWDVETGTQLAEMRGHGGRVTALAVLPGPDGRHRIASGDDGHEDAGDPSVRVWDVDTGTQLAEMRGHVGPVTALAVLPGPEGRHRIVCGEDGERHGNGPSLRVWDADTGNQLADLRGHIGRVTALAVLPGRDGHHWIVSGDQGEFSRGGSIRVWDVNTGAQLTELTGHLGPVNALAVLPGPGAQYQIVSSDGFGGYMRGKGSVRVWDVDTGTQLTEIPSRTGPVNAIAVLPGPGGRHRIASGDSGGQIMDGAVRVWDADTQLADLTGHIGPVNALAVLPRQVSSSIGRHSPDGRHRIISSDGGEPGREGSVRVWDADTSAPLAELLGRTGGVSALAVLPGLNGRHRIVTGGNGSARVWDADTGTQVAEFRSHIGGVTALAVLSIPDGQRLIVVGDSGHEHSDGGSVRVWDADTGTQLAEFANHTGPVRAVAVLPGPGGRHRIVSGDGTGGAYSGGGSVRVWDVDTGTQLAQLPGHTGRVHAVAVLPGLDGRHRIISGDDGPYVENGSVHVWDADTATRLARLLGHTGTVRALAVLPVPGGPHQIVSGDSHGSVRLWDADTGTQLAELPGHSAPVTALTVLPGSDGRQRIVSGDAAGTMLTWERKPGTL